MQFQSAETKRIVAEGSDGNVYDLHRVTYPSLPEATDLGTAGADGRVEWLTSTGAVVRTEDEATFRLGEIFMVGIECLDGSTEPVVRAVESIELSDQEAGAKDGDPSN